MPTRQRFTCGRFPTGSSNPISMPSGRRSAGFVNVLVRLEGRGSTFVRIDGDSFHDPRHAPSSTPRSAPRTQVSFYRDQDRAYQLNRHGEVDGGGDVGASGRSWVDADAMVRKPSGPGGALVDLIGARVTRNGSKAACSDREKLAGSVLEDPLQLRAARADGRHPAVLRGASGVPRQASRRSSRGVRYPAAAYETGGENEFDKVMVHSPRPNHI